MSQSGLIDRRFCYRREPFSVLSGPKKTRNLSRAVPDRHTHFVLEDSLWEDADDEGCSLTSFSSLFFLLSQSLSASPCYCGTASEAQCYKHNCTHGTDLAEEVKAVIQLL